MRHSESNGHPCDQAGTHAVTLLVTHDPDRRLDDRRLHDLRTVVGFRCKQDGWNQQTLDCIQRATERSQVQTCLQSIDRQRLFADISQVLIEDDRLKVRSATPGELHPDGGTRVVITGNRFMLDGPRKVKVLFGTQFGLEPRITSDWELVVIAPAGKHGDSVGVRVIFEPGGVFTLPKMFTFLVLPH